MISKKGILLINLGTPDEPTTRDVKRYLLQFLTDRRVIDYPWLKRQLLVRGLIVPGRNKNSTSLYQKLWTPEGSPLKIYGEDLRDGIQTRVGDNIPVALAMRYQNPSIESALEELRSKQVSDIIVFPLFPQYASASTGSAHEEVMRIVMQWEVIPSLTFIQDYYDHPAFVDVVTAHGSEFDHQEYDHILFSYHGIPERQLEKADPAHHCLKSEGCCDTLGLHNRNCYRAQCLASTRALVEKLKLQPDQYTTCFQSRLGKDPWTKPYTSQVIKELADRGAKKLLVYSPAFVADCLETIIEVCYEYQEEFVEAGGQKIDLVPSLNNDPQWMDAIISIIEEKTPIKA